MIQIHRKEDCCGCNACVQACPKQCITMRDDEEGFAYPTVDTSLCIDCHLCERVCPVLNQQSEHRPLQVLAAINPNEQVRMQSSSGGIFTLLAEQVIGQGGVVFGARFDADWNVVHAYTDTLDGLAAFRGSKYVQSRIGTAFIDARRFLQNGRQVLFSGTPCQIAGLRRFLRRDYPNLLTVEVVCHGVPSPAVWRQYLKETAQKKHIRRITSINFRDKRYGWHSYHFCIKFENINGKQATITMPHADNAFYRGFLNHLYLRPSCYQCPAKGGRSGADVTIADFWGIDKLEPQLDDNRGYSIICVNTEKGNNTVKHFCLPQTVFSYEEVLKYNPSIVSSITPNLESQRFWDENQGVLKTVNLLCGDSFVFKCKKLINRLLHKPKEIK